MMGIAKTGSGKTLAFVLPMLRHIMDQRPLEDKEGPIGKIFLCVDDVLPFLLFIQYIFFSCHHDTHKRTSAPDHERMQKVYQTYETKSCLCVWRDRDFRANRGAETWCRNNSLHSGKNDWHACSEQRYEFTLFLVSVVWISSLSYDIFEMDIVLLVSLELFTLVECCAKSLMSVCLN